MKRLVEKVVNNCVYKEFLKNNKETRIVTAVTVTVTVTVHCHCQLINLSLSRMFRLMFCLYHLQYSKFSKLKQHWAVLPASSTPANLHRRSPSHPTQSGPI
jgi:hypothetical protein